MTFKLGLLFGLLCLACLTAAGTGRAADVTFEGMAESYSMMEARFRLEGDIVSGDVELVKATLKKSDISPGMKIVMALDSPGGNYSAGLDLALLFRRLGFATVVRTGKRCLSACAIAFLGGVDPPKDPTPLSDDDELPNQGPDRSIEPGARLGYHAPYLDISAASYTAQNVKTAYDTAVLGIARFIAIADHLYVAPGELPRLLQPTQDELFMADTVDAVRFLGIDYTDRTLQIRDLRSITRSMVRNVCINRYYHLQRRSSLEGYRRANAVEKEFVEGSELLENREEKLVFGIRRIHGTWIAFMPITKTFDGRKYVWCMFSQPIKPTVFNEPTVFYKPAGTVAELFAELKDKSGLWEFWHSQTTLKVGENMDDSETWIRALDMVPAQTLLTDVAGQLERYQQTEENLATFVK